MKNLATYKALLKKGESSGSYKILADKGYEGARTYIPAILPKKGLTLTSQENRENKKIGSCRIICENYYGRLKSLWSAARSKVRNDLKNYNAAFDICVALTITLQ